MKNRCEQIFSSVIIAAFSCLFSYGFIDNLKGVTLPHLLMDLNFSYSQGGAIQQGAYFGFLASTILTGFLILRFTHRDILLMGAACLFVGILGYSIFPEFSHLLISMVVIGLGLGFLDLVGIRLIVDFCTQNKGRLLNLSAFFHGLASMLAPLFSGVILSAGFYWANVYQFGLIFVAIFTLYIMLMRFPERKNTFRGGGNGGEQIINALRFKKAWLYYILILSYEAVEIGFAVWISEFLQASKGQSASVGILFLSLFFLCIMLGRLLGSFVVERFGYLRMLLIAAVCAAACLTLGIFGPDAFMFLLPLTGFFLSVIFPTATAAASEDLKSSADMSLSLFFTFAGLGGMIGSWAVGVIADLASMQIGFALLILMALNVAAMVIIRMIVRNKKIALDVREAD